MLTMNRMIFLRTAAVFMLLCVFLSSASAQVETIDSRFLNISRTIETSTGIKYAAAVNDGFLVSRDGGKRWMKLNEGLPLKIVYPFKDEEIETITSIGFDPLNESKLVCTTASRLYVSLDSGGQLEKYPREVSRQQIKYTDQCRILSF